jgi:diguanylate cyclase (GGDEF)-like protein
MPVPPSSDRAPRFRILLLGKLPGRPDPVTNGLASHGIEVCRAGSLPQAIDGLEHLLPDALLIDATGAVDAALDACRRLREQIGRRPVPILMLVDPDDEDAVEAAFSAGANDVFVGSAQSKLLAERLAQGVASARMRQQIASGRRQPARYAVSDTPATGGEHRPSAPVDRDPLTGLLNRDGFIDAAHQLLIEDPEAPDAPVRALLLVNLDRFKRLNDALGNSAGDEALQEVARRMRQTFRNVDGVAVGRLGGDEFAVAFASLRGPRSAEQAAEILLTELRRPVNCAGLECVLRASIGIMIVGESDGHPEGHSDGGTVERMLGLAGRAMMAVKLAGGNGSQRFHRSLVIGGRERFGMEISLHQALDRQELALFYQPIVDPGTGRIEGVEALMRWRHQGRFVQPTEFIPIAEETGLIGRLGEWAIRQALHQLRAWNEAGVPVAMVAVNIDAAHLADPALPHAVAAALDASGLDARMLELELTETGVMRDIERSLASLQRLRDLGVRLALDDFGTGYSSLAYLTRLPLDTLKIDGTFVRRLEDSDQSRAVVRSIIALAQALGLSTVAECVETGSQLELLRSLGCDQVQGLYYAPPMPARDLPGWIRRFNGNGFPPGLAGSHSSGTGPSGAAYS